MSDREFRCREYVFPDGAVARIQHDDTLSDEAALALAELVRAAARVVREQPPPDPDRGYAWAGRYFHERACMRCGVSYGEWSRRRLLTVCPGARP